MSWTKLTSLPSKHEADLFAGHLEQAGIQVRMNKSSQDSATWLTALGTPAGPVDVYVPSDKVHEAREIPSEVDLSLPASGEGPLHPTFQLTGRVLLAFALIALVLGLLSNALD